MLGLRSRLAEPVSVDCASEKALVSSRGVLVQVAKVVGKARAWCGFVTKRTEALRVEICLTRCGKW